jgi:SNF2 family DNA or RNA helicase
MEAPKELIFAITSHEVLGTLIEPFVVSVHPDGQFFFGMHRVNSKNVHDYNLNLPGEFLQVLALADEYRDEVLVKLFSKKRMSSRDFFKGLSEEKLRKVIRPYIEKKMDLCLNLLEKHKAPVFYKGKRRNLLIETPIHINDCETKITLSFEKIPEGTCYSLQLDCKDEPIRLQEPNSQLLTRSPCRVLLGNIIYKLPEYFDGNKLFPFFSKECIYIPEKNEEEFYNTFVTSSITDQLVHLKGLIIEEKSESCQALMKPLQLLDGRNALLLMFQYGKSFVIAGDPQYRTVSMIGKNPYRFLVGSRNLEKENEIISLLKQAGLQHLPEGFFLPPEQAVPDESLYSLIEWLNHNQTIFKENNILIDTETSYFTGTVRMSLDIQEHHDWFDVKAVAHFGDYSIPFVQLKKHLLNHIREYELPGGEIAILPKEWFSRFREAMQLAVREGNNLRLQNYQFGILEELDKNRFQKFNQRFQKLIQEAHIKRPGIPALLRAELRPYQERGFAWLYLLHRLNMGGCLADDMGLGKTIQVLSLLLKLKESANTKRESGGIPAFQMSLFGENSENLPPLHTSLLVMPLSLIHNWENEILKFAPSLRYFKHTGNNRIRNPFEFNNYDLILTTYGIVRNDPELFRNVLFSYLVLDESQFVKNPESKAFQAIRTLQSRNRIVLTGTPVENSLIDLWSQMTFLNPGLLGGLSYFKKEYVVPVEKQGNQKKRKELKELIEPFILRRTKDTVAKELPKLVEKVHFCEMSDEQRSLYETKKSEIRNRIYEQMENPGKQGLNIEILQSLMQLRLLANHPQLTQMGAGVESGKFSEVLRNIENLMAEGHKVLIFSQFVKHLQLYKQFFDQQEWAYSLLTGELSSQERKRVIHRFQTTPDNRLFLISLKAGGVGLNLTSADYVFLLDPWWNPAVEKQAINRSHRMGQTRSVISYRFITKDSVEEKILFLQQKKEKLADDFINANNPFRVFSDQEMLTLIE